MRVFVSCSWHGREHSTIALCTDISSRPRTNGTEWIVYHEVNPEGAALARNGTDPCNRVLPRSVVDPNRNFPPLPGDDCNVMKHLPSPEEEYAGPHPFSEPEVRYLAQAMEKAMPLDMALFVHSGTVAFLTPLDGCLSKVPKHRKEHLRWARGMARAYGDPKALVGPAAATLYPATGTASDWAYYHLRVPLVFTLETYGDIHEPDCRKQFTPDNTTEYVQKWSRVWEFIEENHS